LTAESPKATVRVPGDMVGGDDVRAAATAASETVTVATATRAMRRFIEFLLCVERGVG
jgi:hypothetical protein